MGYGDGEHVRLGIVRGRREPRIEGVMYRSRVLIPCGQNPYGEARIPLVIV